MSRSFPDALALPVAKRPEKEETTNNRFSANPQHLAQSLRFVLAGTALLASTMIQALPASADVDLAARNARTALFSVDSPAPNALVSNGAMFDIGGWTAGTRVDAYLDAP